jgi:hypothetical protein
MYSNSLICKKSEHWCHLLPGRQNNSPAKRLTFNTLKKDTEIILIDIVVPVASSDWKKKGNNTRLKILY